MEKRRQDKFLARRDAFRLFDQAPDLSPDIEWMLKSKQVSDDLILESLLEEYLEPLYQRFVSLAVEPDRILGALAETFAKALIERNELQGHPDVESFVHSRVMQVCERRGYPGMETREVSLRHLTEEWNEEPLNSLPKDYPSRVMAEARLHLERNGRSRQRKSRLAQILLVGLIAVLLVAIGGITNRITALETSAPLARGKIVETQIVRITVIVTHTPAPPVSSVVVQPKKSGNFDLASSQLAFQWQEAHPAQIEGSQSVPVDVFADGNFLGQLQVSDPWSSSCERSPDGRYLALVERPDLPPFPFSRLRLFQIPSLQRLDGPLPRGSRYGSDVAFSPDGRYLAFWGCEASGGCGVYLLDLSSQEAAMLFPGRYAGYFTWSPDSKQVAMLSAAGNFLVINAGNGKITYEHAVDWVTKDIPAEAPIHSWGEGFPPVQSDLRGCESPVVS